MNASPYLVRRAGRSRFVDVRGLRIHVLQWDAGAARHGPALVMLHGWMDVAASFQFIVDALPDHRPVFAMDWRGFGLSQRSGSDSYWFADYLGDLDAVLDLLSPDGPVDLLGHSMGGNVAMIYAGVRPERVRRLINLEGFGLPDVAADQAPRRYAQWLDQLKQPATLRRYDSVEAVAERLRTTNPRLREERARWLAAHWARQADDGRWDILGDPAHKRVQPVLYRKAEVLACWQRIAAPVMWVEGQFSDMRQWWGERYPREDFEARLAVVPRLAQERIAEAGHMLHHDQPEQLARLLEDFLRD